MTRLILLFFVLVVAAKAIAAGRLDFFGDEAFYWMCSRRLDIAYADHPFMTALLMRGGSDLFGISEFGARSLFLCIGALFPWVIFLLARPLVGTRDAWLAAGTTLLLPATAYLGVIAIPDVPHLLFAALALCGFERATRTGSRTAWVLAGLATALGLATHYRFVLVPFSIFLYLVATRSGRAQLGRSGPWLSLLALLPGLLPVLLYNLRLDFAPLNYQAGERHQAGGMDLDALIEHIPTQMAAVTPFLYVALICVLVMMVRRWRNGDDRAALLGLFAIVHLGLYFVMSPVADSSHATIHWPAPGYLPLLVFLPLMLRDFVARKPTPGRRALATLVPGFAALVVLLLVFELATQTFGVSVLHRAFAGWSEIGVEARRLLDDFEPGADGRVAVVADNYKLGGNLELKLHGLADIYVLDHRKNREHGRAPQFEQWGNDEHGLETNVRSPALIVVQRIESRSRNWDEWNEHIRSLFSAVEPLTAIIVPGGKEDRPNAVFFYRGIP